MGTEQQQEINLPKPLPKPQRKTILFTDKVIENWKPKKDKEKMGFPRHNTTRGLNVFYRKKTNQKYWEFTNRWPLGSFI